MRILVLATFTADCEKTWRSLQAIERDVRVEVYDSRPHEKHGELVEIARKLAPDAIVFIGAIERYHLRPVPKPEILCRLRDVAPMVHICGDASDEPWWEWLQLYDREACFSAQVSIDGNIVTPISQFANGLVRLTPTDPGVFFPTIPWAARRYSAGMAGGKGHGERARLIDALVGTDSMRWIDCDAGGSYEEMAAFLSECRVVVNSPMNGSGNGDHVKGRVVEAGWARALLLERTNPVTRRWFEPGDYLEYDDPSDARLKIAWAAGHRAEAEAMATRFHARVLAEHHPRVFWREVFALAGVAEREGQIG